MMSDKWIKMAVSQTVADSDQPPTSVKDLCSFTTESDLLADHSSMFNISVETTEQRPIVSVCGQMISVLVSR